MKLVLNFLYSKILAFIVNLALRYFLIPFKVYQIKRLRKKLIKLLQKNGGEA